MKLSRRRLRIRPCNEDQKQTHNSEYIGNTFVYVLRAVSECHYIYRALAALRNAVIVEVLMAIENKEREKAVDDNGLCYVCFDGC